MKQDVRKARQKAIRGEGLTDSEYRSIAPYEHSKNFKERMIFCYTVVNRANQKHITPEILENTIQRLSTMTARVKTIESRFWLLHCLKFLSSSHFTPKLTAFALKCAVDPESALRCDSPQIMSKLAKRGNAEAYASIIKLCGDEDLMVQKNGAFYLAEFIRNNDLTLRKES